MSSRKRYNDEVGSVEPFVLHEVCDEGDSLDGFSQTHLISQDPVQVVVVKRNQPLQTFNLKDKKEEGGGVLLLLLWNLRDSVSYDVPLQCQVLLFKHLPKRTFT